MGRVKSNMELIKKEKTRNTTFEKRKDCLKKKVHELATLCGIKAVAIIYGPKQSLPQEPHPLQPEVWPENRDQVVELIDRYKSQTPEDRKKRTFLVTDFFQERNKKAQQGLAKLRKTNVMAKYPTWDSRFNGLFEQQLRQIAAFLEDKIGNAKAKLEQMKANSNNISRYYAHQLQLREQQKQQRLSLERRSMDFEAVKQANNYFMTFNQHEPMPMPMPMPMPCQQQRQFPMDHCPKRRMLNFEKDYVGVGTSDVFNGTPALANEVYNDLLMAGNMESISYSNHLVRATPLQYYGDPMGQCYTRYPQPPPMTSAGDSSSLQMLVASQHQNDQLDQYYRKCNDAQYYVSDKELSHMSQAILEPSANRYYVSDKDLSHMSHAILEPSANQYYVSDKDPSHMSQATLEPSATRYYVSDKDPSNMSQATLEPLATQYYVSEKEPSQKSQATVETLASGYREEEGYPLEFSF